MKRLSVVAVMVTLAMTACAEASVGTDDDPTTPGPPTSTTTLGTSTTLESDVIPSDAAFDDLVERVSNAPEPTSGRMEVTVSITGVDDPDAGISDVSFGIVTTFDTATSSSSLVMDLSSLASVMPAESDDPFSGFAGIFDGEMEVRRIGDVAYVRMPLFNELLGVDTPWISMSADEGEGFTSDFSTVPTDPEDVMTAYEGAGATVEGLGRERVNGADTDHYRLSFDTSTWLDELGSDERAELEASGLLAGGVVDMEAWVADDGHLVRLVLTVDGTTLDTPPGEGFESMTIRYDLLEVGGAVAIEPPSTADVTSIDDLGFGDFGFDSDA